MSLFDYIAEELSPAQKQQLYLEKSVCLCLFRVVFDQLEQQLLYRIIFSDRTFSLLDIQEMLHIRPKSQSIGSQGGSIATNEELNQAKKDKDSLAEKFISKLMRLDLAQEVESGQGLIGTPGVGGASQSRTPRIPTLNQNFSTMSTGAAGQTSGTPQLGLYQYGSSFMDGEREAQNRKSYRLNKEFLNNVIDILTTKFELTRLKEKKKIKNQAQLDTASQTKWENISKFMLNIIPPQQNTPKSLINLLQQARYIEFDVNAQTYQLTVNGFQYILMDIASQVQNILLNYIQTAETSGRNVVEVLGFIFNLTLTEPNYFYKIKDGNENVNSILRDFDDMGLVGKCMERRQKFVITSLLQSFLQSQTGQLQKSSDSSSSNVIDAQRSQSQDKFLIVETNFKVYAYTSSDLYRALLRQFIRVECIFPNLVVGTLTRKSLQKAFQRGISSGQILSFLESHIHLTARLNKLVQQQNNMAMAQGSINDFGLKNRGLMASGDQKNIPIADLFGLSSSKLKKQKASNQETYLNLSKLFSHFFHICLYKYSTYSFIPPNVRQQVELWEKELKSLKTAPGLLIEFESQKEYGSFLEHAIKNKISIMKKIDQKMLVVVDVKNEKQAYDFIFK